MEGRLGPKRGGGVALPLQKQISRPGNLITSDYRPLTHTCALALSLYVRVCGYASIQMGFFSRFFTRRFLVHFS